MIVIGRTPDETGAEWTKELLASLEDCQYPIQIHETWDFELATIAWAAERFPEFVFLPASTIVKNLSVFMLCFEVYKHKSVSLGQQGVPRFRMYLGKYLASSVKAMAPPPVTTKLEAIHQEDRWCEQYAINEDAHDRLVILGGPMNHTETFVDKHGRQNMVVENEFLRRFKGTWRLDMIQERVR